MHEPMPGVYDFKDQQDLTAFFTTAQKAGLLVILRVGPYICGEWEYVSTTFSPASLLPASLCHCQDPGLHYYMALVTVIVKLLSEHS